MSDTIVTGTSRLQTQSSGPEPGRVSMKNWCRRQQATTEEPHD
jgi:hypothetical protein